ncbi:hypothetical protein DRN62_00325 [Nanoarchaeota archaeon]|nr:MAG: hypothetical protein DRN62_00325 [Nanoarchaeota archaeon]
MKGLSNMIVGLILGLIVLGFLIFLGWEITYLSSSFSSSFVCSLSSRFRHFLHSFSLQFYGVEVISLYDIARFDVPLIGCAPTSIRYGEVRAEDLMRTIAFEAGRCYQQYGGGEWNVMWLSGENPRPCSSIYADLGDQMITFEDLSNFFKTIKFSSRLDCRDCEHACPEGFVCDYEHPEQCVRSEANPLICEAFGVPPKCSEGSLKRIRGSEEEIFDVLSDFACEQYDFSTFLEEGCFDGTDAGSTYLGEPVGGVCSSGVLLRNVCISFGELDGEATIPEDMCVSYGGDGGAEYECMYCEEVVDGKTHLYKTDFCLIHQPTNDSCRKEITYYDYLLPGIKTIYTYRDPSESFVVLENESNHPITGKVRIFIEFLDSFSGTGKHEGIRYLPPECGVLTFVDSCDMCEDECLGGLFKTYSLISGGKKVYGNPLTYTTGPFFFVISTALWQFGTSAYSSLLSCENCISTNIRQTFSEADLVACRDTLLICFYQE